MIAKESGGTDYGASGRADDVVAKVTAHPMEEAVAATLVLVVHAIPSNSLAGDTASHLAVIKTTHCG
ncbi:MAG: hypothetical protein ABR924_19845 [Terracidiphilus sp.]